VDGTPAANLRFDVNGLIPAVAQDAESGQVLMLAYMNAQALARTLETGLAHYYSRSRQRLWQKGEESGHVQRVRAILYDCDEDALLVKVDQISSACHTGNRSCFYRVFPTAEIVRAEAMDRRAQPSVPSSLLGVLSEVYGVILDRKATLPEGSYVASLFAGGSDRILKKVLEESVEVLLASKEADRAQLVYEMADLWFHSLVLLAQHAVTPEEIAQELARRIGKRKAEYA
jgi:phosphoribosyl-ATP pyrophosphohydrolase/phosphoribosyl-AMP cyclohydrolase